MGDLVEFLRARLDEDAERARAAGADEWTAREHDADTVAVYDSRHEPVVYDEGWPSPEQVAHIVRHSPARVLREVEAKQRLMEAHQPIRLADIEGGGWTATDLACEYDTDPDTAGYTAFPCETVRLLALPYADHPDYRPEWAPTA